VSILIYKVRNKPNVQIDNIVNHPPYWSDAAHNFIDLITSYWSDPPNVLTQLHIFGLTLWDNNLITTWLSWAIDFSLVH